MKKTEYDDVIEIYNERSLPNIETIDHSDNSIWWKRCLHSSDVDEDKKKTMYLHIVAFNGTVPIACKEIRKDGKSVLNKNFVSKFKKVKL